MGMHKNQRNICTFRCWGALAVLCIATGIWWFIRGQQRAEPAVSVKDNGGHPALYTIDGSGPLARYDEIYTCLLPEGDAWLLQGVPITDERELQKRLEDYGL